MSYGSVFAQGCSASCQCFAGSSVYTVVVCMLNRFMLYLQRDLVASGFWPGQDVKTKKERCHKSSRSYQVRELTETPGI